MLKVAYIIATVAFAALAEAIFPVVTLGAASGAVTTGIGASTVIAGLAAALGKCLSSLRVCLLLPPIRKQAK